MFLQNIDIWPLKLKHTHTHNVLCKVGKELSVYTRVYVIYTVLWFARLVTGISTRRTGL